MPTRRMANPLYVGRHAQPGKVACRVHVARPFAHGQPGRPPATVVLLAEGDTERVVKEHLKTFLDAQAVLEKRPPILSVTRGRIEIKAALLRKQVELELDNREYRLIGLVDVYPQFSDARAAKDWLRAAVGNIPQFYAHAAQHDVEAWLLPYWDDICRRIHVQKRKPGVHPETVNSQNPPAYRLAALYQQAVPKPRQYNKPAEMREILRGKDLTVAANACPEFKALLNTLLKLSGLTPLP